MSEELPENYDTRAHAADIAWRDAAYEALKAGPLTARELGKRTIGHRHPRVAAGIAVRRALVWRHYFVVKTLWNGVTIDLVPWDYHRRKSL